MYDSCPMNHDDDQDENALEPPSKSQLKRDAEALREALTACRAINARGGRGVLSLINS